MHRTLIAAALVALSGTAHAADAVDVIYEPTPEAAPVGEGWNGFYAGVQIGGAFGGNSGVFSLDRNGDGVYGDYLPAFDPTQAVCTVPVNDGCGFDGDFDDSITGGAHLGYDWQFGQIVVGGILDVNITSLGDRQSGFSGTPAFYHIDRELDYLVTARARLGYALSDRVLAYATGGLAYGDIDYSFVSNTPATSITAGGSDSSIGYTVGGGGEVKVTERISIGLEYLYTNLGGNDYTVQLSGVDAFSGAGSPGFTNARGSDDDFDFHTLQLKMSYRW